MHVNPAVSSVEIYLVSSICLSAQWVSSSDGLFFLKGTTTRITQTNCLSHHRVQSMPSPHLPRPSQEQVQVALPPKCIAYPPRTAASAPGYDHLDPRQVLRSLLLASASLFAMQPPGCSCNQCFMSSCYPRFKTVEGLGGPFPVTGVQAHSSLRTRGLVRSDPPSPPPLSPSRTLRPRVIFLSLK